MMITIIEQGQNLVKLLYFNSFVAIKILLHYDCFNKNSGCLHTTPFTSNFDDICMFLHGYELFRTGSRSFELLADGLGSCGYSWVGGCGWFQVISDGFGWFRVVSGGFCFSSYGTVALFFDNNLRLLEFWFSCQSDHNAIVFLNCLTVPLNFFRKNQKILF